MFLATFLSENIKHKMNTPILFLIFNRPDTAQKVFDEIRKQKPPKLYVAADGARENKPDEKEKSQQTRDIIKQVDWDCDVKTLYRDANFGCKMAVSSAITWFFEQEEFGIILEDDCLPNSSFFQFCEELLLKYKNDERIGHISGNCFLPDVIKGSSYDFCNTAHIWGWASWRRVWKDYDINLTYWKTGNKRQHKNMFNSFLDEAYFSSFISDTLKNKAINTWDVQYLFLHRLTNRLCIYPSKNLVTNIGMNVEGATHMSNKNKNFYIPSETMEFPLIHPENIVRNKLIDKQTTRKAFFSWKRLIRYFLGRY